MGPKNTHRFKKGLDHRAEVYLWLLNSIINYSVWPCLISLQFRGYSRRKSLYLPYSSLRLLLLHTVEARTELKGLSRSPRTAGFMFLFWIYNSVTEAGTWPIICGHFSLCSFRSCTTLKAVGAGKDKQHNELCLLVCLLNSFTLIASMY